MLDGPRRSREHGLRQANMQVNLSVYIRRWGGLQPLIMLGELSIRWQQNGEQFGRNQSDLIGSIRILEPHSPAITHTHHSTAKTSAKAKTR